MSSPKQEVPPVLKAIRRHCLDCMGGDRHEVEACTASTCNLFPFRRGVDPRRQTKVLTEAERARLREMSARHGFKKKTQPAKSAPDAA